MKGMIARSKLLQEIYKERSVNRFMQDIKDFHEKYGLEYHGPPRHLSKELLTFRENFMKEELEEYIAAKGLPGRLDALVDLMYVVLGTAYLHGFPFEEAWRRVHEANMKKIRKESDRSTFDVVKPKGWKAPQLGDLCYGQQRDLFHEPDTLGSYEDVSKGGP